MDKMKLDEFTCKILIREIKSFITTEGAKYHSSNMGYVNWNKMAQDAEKRIIKLFNEN